MGESTTPQAGRVLEKHRDELGICVQRVAPPENEVVIEYFPRLYAKRTAGFVEKRRNLAG